MDFDKLSLELNKLSLLKIDENDLNDPETWLFNPAQEGTKTSGKDEEENLEKWLKGAVEKVDFRTRSALSRKLEKKKRVKDKEKRRNNAESSLSMIEEASSESGPLSDREQQRRPRGEKENMAQRKCISEAGIDSNDDDDDQEEEDEEYFDAPSTPKKMPLVGRNPVAQQVLRKTRNGSSGTLPRNEPSSSSSAKNAGMATLPRSAGASKNVQKAASADEPEFPTEWRNLSDIERRAREQERELQMESMKSRRDRLSAKNSSTTGTPRSRADDSIDSASSSTSSVLSSGAGQHAGHLATSKSVDFRSSGAIHHQQATNTSQSSLATSSRSNEGSMADLSCASTSDQPSLPLNSRLPLPRRPTIPGKTGIPLPAPKRIQRKFTPTSPPADPAPMNDDECF